jgi:hypothetical protein
MKKVVVSSFSVVGLWAVFAGVAAAQALSLAGGADVVGRQAVDTLSTIGSWLEYAGLGTATVAVLIQGYKVMMKNHRWSDIGHVLLGAGMIGGASTLAGIFMRVWG